jgi:hypothetical protein
MPDRTLPHPLHPNGFHRRMLRITGRFAFFPPVPPRNLTPRR